MMPCNFILFCFVFNGALVFQKVPWNALAVVACNERLNHKEKKRLCGRSVLDAANWTDLELA